MAWTTTLVTMLQYYCGDLAGSDYSSTQYQIFIAIATIQVNDYFIAQWPIGGPYTVDLTISTITPDPTTSGPQALSNLIVLKAASILAQSELKKLSVSAGYKIVDDKSSIDTTGAIVALKDRLAAFTAAYESARADFESGNAYAGAAILSPYVPPGDMNLAQFTPSWQRGG